MALINSQFLALINNNEVFWQFDIIGNVSVVGQVTNYTMKSDGIPITIEVKPRPDSIKTVEIPWTSIQTISLVLFGKEVENEWGMLEDEQEPPPERQPRPDSGGSYIAASKIRAWSDKHVGLEFWSDSD